jgi:hypothetical protein
MDVGGWLRSLGLGQYEAVFRDNAIDADVVADLTDGDLEKSDCRSATANDCLRRSPALLGYARLRQNRNPPTLIRLTRLPPSAARSP